ncbi:hypothetical protein A2714_02985 [Candidatus Woesebacteria bacterium RIFCSPHIGHO2_01_FULL_38_9]|uniref:Four helix bundle protein n=2 Tax=Candidatus Woeseibacteriota TaxID=1752722 RepID=A0A1F7XYX5_9BACT|nr:MAG: hypothetical protein A2714_02985 [Candidatus Woesebacteria bacterium RIFCSPHIGHO2_01_FULL_38_9]OGM58895.1 MAG: hypothetical protein A3A75_06510 [Candidatus Woesebacteria bacterium RIFCSPLOWO2_01_FULL_39_10]
MHNYKELKFWKTAFQVTLMVVKLSEKFPNKRVYWIIADQLIRAASSVGANIAEGFGRYKGKEYQRFIQVSLGSANEVEYWLLVVKELSSNLGGEVDNILELNSQTIKMLASTLKTLRNKNKD